MDNRTWMQCDRVMRWLHLYTSLLLVPWMLVYAVSAFCLNHSTWFTQKLQLAPTWKVMREADFAPDAALPQAAKDQAEHILKHLELAGPYVIMGTPDANQLTLIRLCATGHYRVTWHRQQSRLVVEKQQPFSFYSLVNSLHFQHGYSQPYVAHLVWGAIVDFVAVSTLIWVISGIWLWARKPSKRISGGICILAGSVLFAGLTVLLCQ